MRTVLFVTAILAAIAAPGRVSADVFINGENVTGIRNVALVNARVRIDERGNVHIDAPGYSVRRVDIATPSPAGRGQAAAGPAVSAQSPLSRRYYLVTNESGPSQYDIEVFVNGTSVARVRAGGNPVIDLLNRFLRPGRNEVRVVAHKALGSDGRRSQSANHVHRVLIGEGTETNGQVSLESTVVDYSVNASQLQDQTSVFTVTARQLHLTLVG